MGRDDRQARCSLKVGQFASQPSSKTCFWEYRVLIYSQTSQRLLQTSQNHALCSLPSFYAIIFFLSSYSKCCCDKKCCKTLPVDGGYCPKKMNHWAKQRFINRPSFTFIFLLKLLLSVKNMILTAISTVPSVKAAL